MPLSSNVPKPLKSSGFRGFLLLLQKIDSQKFKSANSVKDEELLILLKKPEKKCDFTEYRNWVIINYLLNAGCRAATVRNIQNQDVDLENRQVVFRHNKNGKIQVSPLCSQMVSILADYMAVRRGKPDDYLFCNQYGEMLTENALRLAVAHYNKSRGIQKTSLHLFRHTFAQKYLIDCGGNAFTLQRLLGHSTLTMSKRYCNIYDADIARDYPSAHRFAIIRMTNFYTEVRRIKGFMEALQQHRKMVAAEVKINAQTKANTANIS